MSSQSDQLDDPKVEGPIDPTGEIPVDTFEDDLDDDDLVFAPSIRSGLGRLTTALLVGIALVAAFGAGAYVQKNHGSAGGATATGPGGGAARFGGAFPGGAGGALPGGAGETGGGASTAGGTGTTAAGPAVIGTVVKVSGNTVTVKNFAGKTVTVTVPEGTTVTKSSTIALDDLKAGASVTVSGTTAADGSVSATAVTAR